MNTQLRQLSVIKKAFLILSIIFFGVFATISPLRAQPKEHVTLQLNWKHQFQFAGYYIAKEKGFYEEAGLNVSIKEYDASINIVQDVLSQKSDFGVGRSSLILDKLQGKNVFLLAAIYQHSPMVLITKKRSDLSSVAYLKNKKIMMPEDSISMAPLVAMMAANGVREENYIRQNAIFSVDDLITGKTDALGGYISNEPFQLRRKGVDHTIFSPRDYGFDFYSDLLFTSQERQSGNPDQVNRFYQASMKGWEYAFANIDETIDLIQSRYNSQSRSREALRFEANALKELAYDKDVAFGNISYIRLHQTAQVYRLLGLTRSKESLGDFYLKSNKSIFIKLTEEEKAFLKRHPVIRVHNESGWAPYNFYENGKPQGFSIDYINLIAKKLNIRIEFVSGPTWNEFLEQIKMREIDVMLNIAQTPEREKYLNFTNSYFKLAMALFVRNDMKKIHSIKELSGKRFAVPKGFFFEETLQKYPEIKMVRVKDSAESLQAVAFDRADALLDLIPVIRYYQRKLLIDNVILGGTLDINEGKPLSIHIGVRKDWPLLVSILNKAMSEVSHTEIEIIRNKWFDHGFQEERIVDPKSSFPQMEHSYHDMVNRDVIVKGVIFIFSIILIMAILYFLISRYFRQPFRKLLHSNRFILIGPVMIALFLIVIVFITQIALNDIERQTRRNIGNSLQSVISSVHESIQVWLGYEKTFIKLLSQDPLLIRLTRQHLRLNRDGKPILPSPALKRLRDFFYAQQELYGDFDFFVISPDRTTIAASDDYEIGEKSLVVKKRSSQVKKAFAGNTVFIPPIYSDRAKNEIFKAPDYKESAVFFGTPIKNRNEKVIAILVIRMNRMKEFTRLIQMGRIGLTGETYAFKHNGRFITESRFTQQKRLYKRISDPGGNLYEGHQPLPQAEQPLTLMAKSATAGKRGTNLKGYRDYRGSRVLGTWLWDHELGIGLATEIDERESLAPFHNTRTIMLVVLGLTVFLSILLTIVSLWLGRRANVILKKSESELEKKVEERTQELTLEVTIRKKSEQEIQKNVDTLERFQKLTVGRELKMIKLKEEVNQLRREKGKPDKYTIVT